MNRLAQTGFSLFALLPLTLFAKGGDLQVRAGYFRFADHAAREIYHEGAPDVELQADFFVAKAFNPWINVNYVWKEGRSDPLSDKTKLQLGTVSLGSNFQFSSRSTPLAIYLGIGISGAYVDVKDHSHFLLNHTQRLSIGAVGKSGLLVKFNRLLWDLFFDYYYQPVTPRSTLKESKVNVGGFRTGIGLGFLF